jgi:DNA-binding MarR family transcriptional regulator
VVTLDKIIHERVRLRILTYLATSDKEAVSFGELQVKLSLTSGNLSIQLKKLQEAGYSEIHKTFKDNKPYTTASLTLKGSQGLTVYVEEMEGLISALKK